MKYKIIDGKKYKLVPVEEPKTILDDYLGTQKEDETKMAVPKVYDWKVELRRKRRRNMENSVLRKMPRQDGDLDKFGDLIVGKGLEQTF